MTASCSKGGSKHLRVVLSAETAGPSEVPAVISGLRTVRLSGRLLEIDYRDRTAEVWDSLGQMTRIRFSDHQRAQVDAARQQHVVVEGVLDVAPSGRLGPVILQAVLPVQVDRRFWSSPPLEVLVEEQGVRPIPEPAALVASLWEEDDVEEFLNALRRWRQES